MFHQGFYVRRRDKNEDEVESEEPFKEEVQYEIDPREIGFLRAISNIEKGPKMEVSTFIGSLNPKELKDWINDMEWLLECEEIEDLDRVKFAKTKLMEHANIWWK